jgi:hypothetical protein
VTVGSWYDGGDSTGGAIGWTDPGAGTGSATVEPLLDAGVDSSPSDTTGAGIMVAVGSAVSCAVASGVLTDAEGVAAAATGVAPPAMGDSAPPAVREDTMTMLASATPMATLGRMNRFCSHGRIDLVSLVHSGVGIGQTFGVGTASTPGAQAVVHLWPSQYLCRPSGCGYQPAGLLTLSPSHDDC